jgi:hypothetical protein
MASTNERLYNTVFPGYNNVVRYVVVYAAMSWMALQADRYLQANPRKSQEETEEVQMLAMQKMELVLLWLGGGDADLAGKSRSFPTANKSVLLKFSEWNNKSSLMAAVNYGPSITNGLGFLDSNWICSDKGRALAQAFGERLGGQSRCAWLADVEIQTATAAKIKELRSVVDVLQPTASEVRYFLEGFFPKNLPPDEEPRDQDRWRGLHLMLAAIESLEMDGVPTEASIRAAMARGATRKGRSVIRGGLEKIQAVWAVLQVRQLQRVASESLFAIAEAWIRRYDRSHKSIDDCVSALADMVSQEMQAGRRIASVQDILDDLAGARGSHRTFYGAAAAGQGGTSDVFLYLKEFASKAFRQKMRGRGPTGRVFRTVCAGILRGGSTQSQGARATWPGSSGPGRRAYVLGAPGADAGAIPESAHEGVDRARPLRLDLLPLCRGLHPAGNAEHRQTADRFLRRRVWPGIPCRTEHGLRAVAGQGQTDALADPLRAMRPCCAQGRRRPGVALTAAGRRRVRDYASDAQARA